jgi:hypothetical protein
MPEIDSFDELFITRMAEAYVQYAASTVTLPDLKGLKQQGASGIKNLVSTLKAQATYQAALAEISNIIAAMPFPRREAFWKRVDEQTAGTLFAEEVRKSKETEHKLQAAAYLIDALSGMGR